MSGATKVAELTAENGKVVLPKTATFSKTSNHFVYNLYSWVEVDETGKQTAEYVVNSSTDVELTLATNKTLYAKYKSDKLLGDINGKSGVNTLDLRDFKKGVMSTDDTLSARVREYVYVIDK